MSMEEWLKRALARFAATIAAKETAMSDKQIGVTPSRSDHQCKGWRCGGADRRVRVGGIYALEGVMNMSEQYRQPASLRSLTRRQPAKEHRSYTTARDMIDDETD